jgi:peptidoglycan/xylan/chitin deacetylase (PgdA/CDA1 family)
MKNLILLSVLLFTSNIFAQKPQRFVAVTIDDLPVVAKNSDLKLRQEITRKLLGHIKKSKIPAIGFVNEAKLYRDEKLAGEEVDLLKAWIDAGLELGNHTYSHMSLHDNTLADYEANILKGEIVTKKLLEERNKKIRFFRHPYLWTGLSLEIKSDLGKFLTEHNYTIAPVSIDNSDWIFARAYDNAIEQKDSKLKKKIAAAYLAYMDSKTDYWERQSVKLFGREIKQILLIHANAVNADHLDDLMKMFEKRNYKFVGLEEALKDEAYKLPDTFIKRNGISWLHRWALEKGKGNILPDEPKTPDFVLKAAGVDSE